MQLKTIKTVITNKLNDWLNSIEDEQLRLDLKNNILVSGGSITSLLLQEPVNDYDIYIKNVDLAYRVAEYYTKNYKDQVEVFRGDKKEQYIKENELGVNDTAGITVNFFNNLKPEQVKLYTHKNIGFLTDNKDEGLNVYKPIYFSPHAISLSDKIQIVLRFTGSNEEIHKNFDFIHATNYFTFKEGLVLNIEALTSIITKQLKYQGSLYPVTSIIRIKKFLKRGWKINAGEEFKIMFQISQLDLTDIDILEEQLAGIDVAYFFKLIEILNAKKLKDPNFKLQYEYIATIIDKIFNEPTEEVNIPNIIEEV